MRRWWAGIDWSWGLQDFVILDDEGSLVTHLRVPESPEGVREILGALRALNPTSHRFTRRQVPIAIEEGGRLLVTELLRHRQPVIVIPPAVTSRYRGRHSAAVSKSDRGDAALLADIIRQNPARRRTAPATSDQAAAITVLARAQAASAENARTIMVRLRAHLGLFFPAAVEAWAGMQHGLRRPEARAMLTLAPTPRHAAALSKLNIYNALAAAGRLRLLDHEASRLQNLFSQPRLRQHPETEEAMGTRTRLLIAELDIVCQHANELAEKTDVAFSAHPHYKIYRSFPACGPITAARLFAEIGDDLNRFPTHRQLRAYAGTAPITWSSGSSHSVVHRNVCNRTLKAAVHHWAFGSLTRSPGSRALYETRRKRGDGYAAALRHVGNRLLSGLHHCLRTDQLYNEIVMFKPTATPD
ncbi:IS110 family transposase [Streptomyces sp. NBC_00654]|uniref:IS110 family transposase n=1 Tax=Streptomyces sp. NBC_00654 TaxID=2975799 RepID=UPI0022564F7C|nr:IS110 family transposase [Streptomyces sp. NBC_00654]MCX4970848.1 IS110 family transposase [Streptomyces sp. NBC_00654]